VSKGAQRWLDLGVARIQPSELMKIAMPLMLAWFFQVREGQTRFVDFLVSGVLLVVPVGLILVQPDLGTSLLVAASGLYVIYFAGLSWKLLIPLVVAGVIALGSIVAFGDTLCQPEVDWQVLREYQKQRVCTLLDPTRDPLGKGFHIIQYFAAVSRRHHRRNIRWRNPGVMQSPPQRPFDAFRIPRPGRRRRGRRTQTRAAYLAVNPGAAPAGIRQRLQAKDAAAFPGHITIARPVKRTGAFFAFVIRRQTTESR
jgi:hypothetical protein